VNERGIEGRRAEEEGGMEGCEEGKARMGRPAHARASFIASEMDSMWPE